MLRPLLHYLKPYRWKLVPVVVASALEMGFNAQLPLSVKFMIDKALLGHSERMMLIILLALAAGTLVVSASSMYRDFLYTKIVCGIVTSIRRRMFEHLQTLSLDFFARTDAGDVMSRFSNDVAAVESGLAAGVAWGLQPFMDLLLSVILVFTLECRLASIGVLLCPLCVLGPRLLQKKATRASVAKQEEESRIMTTLQESLMAPALVRSLGLEEPMKRSFGERIGKLLGSSVRLGFFTSLMERSASFGTLLLQSVVMGISGWFAFHGSISIGTFASFQALFASLSYSFMYLAQYTPNLITAGGGAIRVEELLAEMPGVTDAPDAHDLAPFSEAIELRDVVFSYTGAKPNLDGVSLRIPKGSSVALVGPSGSGKSTVLSLLLRFYDPASGTVTVDGTDLKRVRAASLRSQTAVVFQESFLFNVSLRDNISLGRPGATDEEIVRAAEAAQIHDFIAALPERYQTLAGERGGRFSGGQRQRIAIARAILADPAILLLDEATSALDATSEQAVNETLRRAAAGRTVISVTHRLSSAVHMDRVMLFDKGKLIEEGSHAELLSAGGAYARLWQKQSGVHMTAGAGAAVDAAWLAQLPLMKGVAPETLAELAQWFSTEEFAEHRTIVRQGDPGNRFYIVVRGVAEVTRDGEGTIAKLSDGDYFGEMALLSNQPRNATVRTLTPCVCLSLARDLFGRLLAKEPALKAHIEAAAAARSVPQ